MLPGRDPSMTVLLGLKHQLWIIIIRSCMSNTRGIDGWPPQLCMKRPGACMILDRSVEHPGRKSAGHRIGRVEAILQMGVTRDWTG